MSSLLLFKHLLFGAALSFVGSLPFGLINITCSKISIRKGLESALWFAAGAAMIEALQAFISIRFASFMIGENTYKQVFSIFSIALFSTLGIYYFFFAKTKASGGQENTAVKRTKLLLQGCSISALNLMVFPYWIFYYSYLKQNAYLSFQADEVLFFISGAGIGTFLLLYLYAAFAQALIRRFEQMDRLINKSIALIFFALALISALQL